MSLKIPGGITDTDVGNRDGDKFLRLISNSFFFFVTVALVVDPWECSVIDFKAVLWRYPVISYLCVHSNICVRHVA